MLWRRGGGADDDRSHRTTHRGERGEHAGWSSGCSVRSRSSTPPAALDIGGSKPRLVLVQLLLNPNRMVSTDALVDALWGDDSSADGAPVAAIACRQAAAGARRRRRPPPLAAAGVRARGRRGAGRPLAERDAGTPGPAALGSDPRQARDLAQRASAEWRGEPLADLGGHDPLVPHVRDWTGSAVGLTELEVDAQLASGDTADAVDRLESLVVVHPEHEPFWARLMTAHYRQGRQRDALLVSTGSRRARSMRLGSIRRPSCNGSSWRSSGRPPSSNRIPPRLPVQGFGELPGRRRRSLLRARRHDRRVGRGGAGGVVRRRGRELGRRQVVDPAGRAGQGRGVRKRERDRPRRSVITPGAAPLRSIYQVPQSVDLLVVDQFEELFTLTDDEATQREFVRLLLVRVNDGTSAS